MFQPLEYPGDMRLGDRVTDPVDQARQPDVTIGCRFQRFIHARLPRRRPTCAQVEADEFVRELLAPQACQTCEIDNRYRIVFNDDAATVYLGRDLECFVVPLERALVGVVDGGGCTGDCALQLGDPLGSAAMSDDDGLHSGCSNSQGRGDP